MATYGVQSQGLAETLKVEAAGIEPENESTQSLSSKQLTDFGISRAANALHYGCSNCQSQAELGSQPSDLDSVMTYYCYPTLEYQRLERELPQLALTSIAYSDKRSNSAKQNCINDSQLSEQCPSANETNFLTHSPKLQRIVHAWDDLPPHIQDTIVTLVDSARQLNSEH